MMLDNDSIQRLVWLGSGDLAKQFHQRLIDLQASSWLASADKAVASHDMVAMRAWQKVGVRRQQDKVPSGFSPMSGDLALVGTWLSILQQAEQDAWVISLTPSRRTEAGYHDAYCLPMQQLGEALQQTSIRPKRVVFVSSTSVYGQNRGESVDENSPVEPRRFNGQQLVCAENILRGLPWGEDTQISILRLAGIYGRGRTRLLTKVLNANAIEDLGELKQIGNRIHSYDAAGMVAHLLAQDRLEPYYIGCDTKATPSSEVFLWLAQTLREHWPEKENLPRLIDELQQAISQPSSKTGKECLPKALTKEGFKWRYPNYQIGYLPIVRAFCQGMNSN